MAGWRPGSHFLIHGGSGGVGHFAIQFAKAKGAHVYTTVSTANVAFAELLGADVVIDYKIAALRRSRVQFGYSFRLDRRGQTR